MKDPLVALNILQSEWIKKEKVFILAEYGDCRKAFNCLILNSNKKTRDNILKFIKKYKCVRSDSDFMDIVDFPNEYFIFLEDLRKFFLNRTA